MDSERLSLIALGLRILSKYRVSPGDILGEILKEMELSVEYCAAIAELPVNDIVGILAETTLINDRIAYGLEKATGIKSYIWAALEHEFRER